MFIINNQKLQSKSPHTQSALLQLISYFGKKMKKSNSQLQDILEIDSINATLTLILLLVHTPIPFQ